MSILLRIIGATYSLALLACGCTDTDGSAAATKSVATGESRATIPNEESLNRLLVSGMLTNEIVSLLGQPRLIEHLTQGEEVWHHTLPPFPKGAGTQGTYVPYVIGVTIGITNGHLAYWHSVSGGVPVRRVTRREEVTPTGQEQVELGRS